MRALHDAGRGAAGSGQGPVRGAIGDPAYDPWPLIEQIAEPFAAHEPVGELRRRTGLVADVLGLDAARIASWGMARSVEAGLWAWAETNDVPRARAYLARAAHWAALA